MASTSSSANKKKAELLERNRLNDELLIGSLMSSSEGRRWLWNKLEEGRLFRNDADFDPYHMAFEKGERNAALRLLDSIQRYASKQYTIMLQENTSYKEPELKEDEDGGPD